MTTNDEPIGGSRMPLCRLCGTRISPNEVTPGPPPVCGKCATATVELPPIRVRSFIIELPVTVIDLEHPSNRRTRPARFIVAATSHAEAVSAFGRALDNLIEE